MVLPAVAPAATPLPYKYDPAAATSPTGDVISADSRSMLMNGKRVYPISGEVRAIHSDVFLFNPIHAFSAAHTCALVVPFRL